MGAVGVFVVVSQQSLEVSLETGFLFGALCLIANALCFAVYSTLVRGISQRYPPLTVTATMMIAGTLGLVLVSAVTEDWSTVRALSGSQWIAIVYLAIACSVLGVLLLQSGAVEAGGQQGRGLAVRGAGAGGRCSARRCWERSSPCRPSWAARSS